MRAIISVYDKSGIVELAQGLLLAGGLHTEIYSTGGTMRALQAAGVAVQSISDLTGFPEILDGRVKTLHPAVHSGILARRDLPEHMAQLDALNLQPIDVVVNNLYPFVQTIREPGVTFEQAVEEIDIGGPSMIRAAAKNHASVLILVDPADYGPTLREWQEQGEVSAATRVHLAAKAFQYTASYDTYIAQYLREQAHYPSAATRGVGVDKQQPLSDAPAGVFFPANFSVSLHQIQQMRYGENPHQQAALYADSLGGSATLVGSLKQLQGKELSYNNILDADAALAVVRDFREAAVVIVKHNNPCGLAVGADLLATYQKALAGDPVSAFGGIVGINRPVDAQLAAVIAATFYEVVIAPEFSAEAVQVLARKKNLRLLAVPDLDDPVSASRVPMLRQVSGGFLVQERDAIPPEQVQPTVVSERAPTVAELHDLLFAWRACTHVKSNAIVLAKDDAVLGIGPGQPNRLDSVRLAVSRAGNRAAGSVLASDAFFPFADGLEVAAEAGVTAAIQPGGSQRDAEVIAAANKAGMAMVFTGQRHFKH